MTSRVGQQVGNYRLVQLLGRGGFAEVYLGEHIYLKKQAAIKILHTQLTSQDLERFLQEAQTIAQLQHPNIIHILDFGINPSDNSPYLIMGYVPKGTLRQVHPHGSIIPLSTVISYVKDIAAALQYTHNAKLIHRDIKPENMLLGGHNEVILSDFGIAVVAHSTSSLNTQDSFGTVHYMAPEHLGGKPRPASDQYSLAVVVYEWLTGVRPFGGSSHIEIAMQQMTAIPRPLRERVPIISPEVEQVVLTALAKEPQQRFKSIQAFATALEQAGKARIVARIGARLLTYRGHSNSVIAITWSPDSTRIASISDDNTLQVWDVQIGRTIFVRDCEWFYARTVGYSPDGTRIATPSTAHSSTGGVLQVWNALDGNPVMTCKTPDNAYNYKAMKLAWSPDSKRLASINVVGQLYVWLVATGEEDWDAEYLRMMGYKGAFDDPIPDACVAWSPDGSRIAYGRSHAGWGDNFLHIVDAADGHELFTLTHGVYDVAWSPDGSRIACKHSDTTGSVVVSVWDVKTQRRILSPRNPSKTIAWSPDSSKIVSAGADGAVYVWDTATGHTLFTYTGHSGGANVALWSPDSTRIASGGIDGVVQVWRAP